ncbi:uncharacterized protein LOC122507764 [Leptopilina heterotoma]|uniref:uncharacterized protein LOC122507764 n=1 Tax=Leptopilina heterotoma TaxID=63436 RepID=UPI001CA809AF|nr:uncharacterized protein LOC122507764 [Leptopilina heterotoma]
MFPYINKFENDEKVKNFITYICSSSNQEKIVYIICLLTYNDNNKHNQEFKILRLLQNVILHYYYDYEKLWFSILESIYKSRFTESKKLLLMKAQKHYEAILRIDEKKQDLMREAFHMVNNSLNSQIDHSCNSLNNGTYKLHLQGNVINFSDILYTQYCPGKVTVLEMFAFDKIIIDYDLISNELQQVIILAPNWEIISNRIIRLEGAPGENSWKAGTFSDRIYGLHGSPGGPGGSLFGIADNIVNGENLHIVIKGGKGSDGQDGYDLVWNFENISWCDTFRENFEGEGGKGGTSGAYKIHLPSNVNDSKIHFTLSKGNDGRSGKFMRLEVDYAYIQNMVIVKESLCQIVDRRMKNELSISSSNIDTDIFEDNFMTSISHYRIFILNKALTLLNEGNT